MPKFKTLTQEQKTNVVNEIKLMIFAHRDALWNRFNANPNYPDPRKIRLVCSDGYYGEAFGILRGLKLLGYGYFGSSNRNAIEENRGTTPEHNLRWWIAELEEECLIEDGFDDNTTSHEKTQYLLDKYRKLTPDT